MTLVELGMYGTIALAVLCWGYAEARRSRTAWASGALLALVHSAVAFMTVYGGSHEVARIETARQTAALTGVEFSGGIYVNYAFLVVWSVDALWWLASPVTYRSRGRLLDVSIRAFILFIVINGAIVFADGWARASGIAAVAMAAAGFLHRSRVPARVPGTRAWLFLP